MQGAILVKWQAINFSLMNFTNVLSLFNFKELRKPHTHKHFPRVQEGQSLLGRRVTRMRLGRGRETWVYAVGDAVLAFCAAFMTNG